MSEEAEEVVEQAVLDDQLADVADAIHNLARKLALRSQDVREIVPLTGTEVEVIREIVRGSGTTLTEIATATGLQRSNVSAALRILESRGLITKEPSAQDARYVRVVATEFALENIQKIRSLWVRRLRTVPEDVLTQTAALRETLMVLDRSLDH